MAKTKLELLILFLLLLMTYQTVFTNKFFPGVYVGDTSLLFLTKSEARKLLLTKFNQRSKEVLTLSFENKSFNIDLANTASIKLEPVLDEAYAFGRSGEVEDRLKNQLSALFRKKIFIPEVDLSLDNQLQQITQSVGKPAQDAKLTPELTIQEGATGTTLDQDTLLKSVKNYLFFGQIPQTLPTKELLPEVTNTKVATAKTYLQSTEANPIKLDFEGNIWLIDQKTLLLLLNLRQDADHLVDDTKLSDYLKGVAQKINQPLKEAQFNFNPQTTRVSTFQPAQEGRELDIQKTAELLKLAIRGQRPKNITLPVSIIQPKIQTEEVNNLGIKELIGRGISNFVGSIPNRIYNIGLTATKINGVLIPPGKIFSFNATVGDITAATGFRQAYVIKEGRTVLDDGGGVCQDSTTLFRAVLNAGLPVLKRTAHAYRVGYYEQGFPPGLDATVFYPTVDFQFKNDTGAHILIQAHTEGATLYVELYGSSDGRVSTLTKPVVTDITPAPAELHQDDPTLAVGVVKQVDFAAAGAKVSFQRTVKRGGEVLINETWHSSYKPWQAIYLVGTGG